MSSNQNEKNNTENNEKNNNIIKNKSQNTNNESVEIIIAENYKNNPLNLISNKIKNKKEDKNDLYQDKEVIDDNTMDFSNKLKDHNKSYQNILYFAIILYIIDIIIWFKSEKILHNFFSLFSTLMILFSNIYQAYIFRHNFEIISKELYIYVGKIIYIHLVFFVLYIVNIMYIFISKLLEMTETKYIYENKTFYNLKVIIYCFINICVPCIQLFALIFLKNAIKDLSISRGEIFESDKIGEIEIVQSD